MIDPTTLIKPSSSTKEKQIFLLFCIFVAGRNSDIASDKLAKFLSNCKENQLPFDYIKENLVDLHNILVANKLGPSENRWQLRSQTYKGIARAMAQQWG